MIFKKKKVDPRKIFEKVGLFYTVELSEVSRVFGVSVLKLVGYYKGEKIEEMPYSREKHEELEENGIPVIVIETQPKEFEEIPYNKLLLGRLELPRLGLVEE